MLKNRLLAARCFQLYRTISVSGYSRDRPWNSFLRWFASPAPDRDSIQARELISFQHRKSKGVVWIIIINQLTCHFRNRLFLKLYLSNRRRQPLFWRQMHPHSLLWRKTRKMVCWRLLTLQTLQAKLFTKCSFSGHPDEDIQLAYNQLIATFAAAIAPKAVIKLPANHSASWGSNLGRECSGEGFYLLLYAPNRLTVGMIWKII